MTPALCSDSAAVRIVAPSGIVTLAGAPSPPHPAEANTIETKTAQPALARTPQHMLQQYRGGQRIDIATSVLGSAAEFVHGTARRGGRVPLIDQLDGQARPPLQLDGDPTHFRGAIRIVAVLIQRKAEDEASGVELPGALDELGDRRALAPTPGKEACW
jgi:hypothetical protein